MVKLNQPLGPETVDWLDAQAIVNQGLLLMVPSGHMPYGLCPIRYPALIVPTLLPHEADSMVVAIISTKYSVGTKHAQLLDALFQDAIAVLVAEGSIWARWYSQLHEQLVVRVHKRSLELEQEADSEFAASCRKRNDAIARCTEVPNSPTFCFF